MLDEILEHKREEVEQRRARSPLSRLLERARPTRRGALEEVLSSPEISFILECKKASPSRGLIREDFDPVAIARAYKKRAAAISVLTDERFFQGSFEILATVRREVDVPVLCKDFILEPYQVVEARVHGADAVLLMLSALDDRAYRACASAAKELGMSCLTEVHDSNELERALSLGALVIGINNRDLKTLQVDLSTTEELAPLVPSDRLVVSESGVMSHQDVRRLGPLADAFLIGSSLMKRDDIALAASQLAHGHVKICGLTRPEDAHAALELGASYGGVIFAPESSRCISLEQARHVRQGAPRLPFVGVFVNASVEQISVACQELGLAAVQLHGEETRETIAAIRAVIPRHTQIWKAHRVASSEIPTAAALGVDRILLEANVPGARGGTGTSFDWSLLDGVSQREDVILAGGLSPDNARDAACLGGFMLDVCSGVERSPGIKSIDKMKSFFDALHVPARSTLRGKS